MHKRDWEFFKVLKSSKYMFRLVWSERSGRLYIFLKSTIAIVTPMFTLIYSIIPGIIINELLKGQFSKKLALLLCIQLFAPFIHHIVNSMNNYFSDKLQKQFYIEFERKWLYFITCMDYDTLENPEIQILKDRASDTTCYTLDIVCQITKLISSLLSLLAISSIISYLNPLIIIVVLLVGFINSLATKWLNRNNYIADKEKANLGPSRHAYSSPINSLFWAKDIRLFNLKSYLIENYIEIARKEDRIDLQKTINNQKSKTVHAFTNLVQQCTVYIYLIYCVLQKGTGIGDMTIFMSAVNQFAGTLNNVSSTYMQMSKMQLRINDVDEFLKIVPHQYRFGSKKPHINKTSIIEFRNVSFRYPGSERLALGNISLKINLNEKLCIVGLNGSGKSTFIKLLTRLYMPESGEILLDGININEFDYEEYQRLFAPVFQDVALFHFSLKDNIVLNQKEDVHRLNEVLEKCGLSPLVTKLQQGYDTQVYKSKDENGFIPSGGEEQKISIARALYHGGEIFILDEPTAALDPIAEYEIYTQFANIIQNKPAILITHRLSAVQLADKVAVFDNGSVAEYGTHKELYEKGGIYTEMFDKQAQFYRDETPNEN